MASENCERFGPQARAVFEAVVKAIHPTLPEPHHRKGREVHDEGWRDLRAAHIREHYIHHLRTRVGHHLEVDTKTYRTKEIGMRQAVLAVVSESERVAKDLTIIELLHKLDEAMAKDRTAAEVTSKQ